MQKGKVTCYVLCACSWTFSWYFVYDIVDHGHERHDHHNIIRNIKYPTKVREVKIQYSSWYSRTTHAIFAHFYHGTTIQITQPLPELSLATPTTLGPHKTTNAHPVTDITASVLSKRRQWLLTTHRRNLPVTKQQQTTAAHTGSARHMWQSTKRKPSLPANYPHNLAKQGPKRRTVAVKSLADILSTTAGIMWLLTHTLH